MTPAIYAEKGLSGVRSFALYIGRLCILWVRIHAVILTTPLHRERFLVQARRVGPGSFFISSLVAFFVGVIISLQMAYMMMRLSAEIYIPNVVAVALTRELGPVLTALIVAGRIGAGITAEIGSMVASDQIDALKAFAVDPLRYLAVPRYLGLILMLPVLTVFAVIVGIFGGFAICHLKLAISPHMYWQMVCDALAVKDIATGLIKALVFAAIIATVGCYEGFHVRGGADGVGRATTLSVVRAFILIIASDCFFTFFFYFVFNA